MAKSRKRRKNYKLRKRVMRTVSALTMVMAVAVAAVPVENLSTIQAKNSNVDTFDMKSVYTPDESKVFTDAGIYYDDSLDTYTTDGGTVQQIIGDTIYDVYQFKKKATDNHAVVSGPGNVANITINGTEYYDYILFDSTYIDALDNQLKDKNYNIEYEDDVGGAKTTVFSGGWYKPDADSEPVYLQQIPSGDLVQKLKTVPKKEKITLTNLTDGTSTDNHNKYTEVKTNSITVTDVYEKTGERSKLASQKTLVNAFNNQFDKFKAIQDSLAAASGSATVPSSGNPQTWKEEWDDYIVGGQCEADYQAAKTLEISYTDLTKREGISLSEFQEYVIKNCYKLDGGNATLSDFDFVSMNKENAGAVLLAQSPTKKTTAEQITEKQYGYLVTGQVTIDGIQKGAFSGADKDKVVREVTVSKAVKFIGDDAFKDSILQRVVINADDPNNASASGCSDIGDGAFSGCLGLRSVELNGNSLNRIGQKAFNDTVSLQTITIPSSVNEIGAGCFMASGLTSVLFPETISSMKLGAYSFYNCGSLEGEIKLPSSGKVTIGRGAFAVDSEHPDTELEFVFPQDNTSICEDGSSCYKYTPGAKSGNKYIVDYCNNDYILAGRANLKKVTWPGKLNSTIPDNTLAGCVNLQEAVFLPDAHAGTYIPRDEGYNETEPGKSSGKYEAPEYKSGLFRFVDNPDFFVTGPKTGASPSSKAKCRECTWEAISARDNGDGVTPMYVPYKYSDGDDLYFELGVSAGNYYYNIYVTDKERKEAELLSFEINDAKAATLSNERLSLTIGHVGDGYTIVEIGEHCLDVVKDKIYDVTLEDGAVRTINNQAFYGCGELQRVFIGSDVYKVGDEAFAQCQKLENVFFSQAVMNNDLPDDDPNWASAFTKGPNGEEGGIGANAFNTQSKYLTFHGAVNEDFAPYKLAMSSDSYKDNGDCKFTETGALICYKTDQPLNLTIMRGRPSVSGENPTSGKATLVNYPYYSEISKDNEKYFDKNKDAYKAYLPEGTDCTYAEMEKLFKGIYSEENTGKEMPMDLNKIMQQTLNLRLPSGIESVDSKNFLNETKNANDAKYYIAAEYDYNTSQKTYENNNKDGSPKERENKPLVDLYSKDATGKDDSYGEKINRKETVAIGGLFGGYSKEISVEMGNDEKKIWTDIDTLDVYTPNTYKERYSSGNDFLTTVTMNSVEELPDYAFDSCENLLKVSFTDAMQKMGTTPFRGCINLQNIDTDATNTGNNKYEFANMLLYEVDDAGNATIVECLEGRGKRNDKDNNLDYGIVGVDFSDNASPKEIPDDLGISRVTGMAESAFANNPYITTVNLKNTDIGTIPYGAFENASKLSSVTLSESTGVIYAKAFDGDGKNQDLHVIIPSANCSIAIDAFDFDEDVTGNQVVIHSIKYSDEATGKTGATWNTYSAIKDKLKKEGGDSKANRIVWDEYTDILYNVTFLDHDMSVIKVDTVTKGGNAIPPDAKHGGSDPVWAGYKFTGWAANIGNVSVGENDDPKPYENVTENRILVAQYVVDPNPVIPDENPHYFTIVNGTAQIVGVNGDEEYEDRLYEKIPENTRTELRGGWELSIVSTMDNFSVWTTNPSEYISLIADPSSNFAGFTMPNDDVTITANAAADSGSQTPGGSGSDNPGGSGSGDSDNPGGSGSGSGDNDNKTKYKLTVNYGSGSGEYEAGTSVTISAYAPESSSRVFSRWTSNNSSLGFASATSATTTLVMPAADATVTANYKARVDDDDEDDDDTSRRPNTNTTTTVTNPSSNSGSNGSNTSGTVTNNNNNNNNGGSKIYITKNGVSNKDLASVSVSGSTDNFIVRISETDEATAAAEEALINRYGSLDGLVYFPMDISLYDSTGQNKITDTYGLNITITMPIPDVLIQYGGNSRVAATDNGTLQALNPVKFTTIDGIACISFVPPHFSPYVIYVDTNNLTAGQTLDSTPSTGDPIHPKWFLALGMACVSVILFAASDGRKRKKYRTA